MCLTLFLPLLKLFIYFSLRFQLHLTDNTNMYQVVCTLKHSLHFLTLVLKITPMLWYLLFLISFLITELIPFYHMVDITDSVHLSYFFCYGFWFLVFIYILYLVIILFYFFVLSLIFFFIFLLFVVTFLVCFQPCSFYNFVLVF